MQKMTDSTVPDLNKMKVLEIRKELKLRGLKYYGCKAELVARLQSAISQENHADIIKDKEDKSDSHILDDPAVETLNEELALADCSPPPKPPESTHRFLKRKITMSDSDKDTSDGKSEDAKDTRSKKKLLNSSTSVTTVDPKPVEATNKNTTKESKLPNSNRVRINADIDPKTRLEMRAKRFGLLVTMSEAEKKEARKLRFGQSVDASSTVTTTLSGRSLSVNLENLKKRAERFGQSVSKIMIDIENKEKLEKRKLKFGAVTQ